MTKSKAIKTLRTKGFKVGIYGLKENPRYAISTWKDGEYIFNIFGSYINEKALIKMAQTLSSNN